MMWCKEEGGSLELAAERRGFAEGVHDRLRCERIVDIRARPKVHHTAPMQNIKKMM